MEACLDVVRTSTRHHIVCTELSKGPPGIETDEHVTQVIPLLKEAVAASDADAIVVSCFSDPGLRIVRAATDKPVIGIAEAAYLAALSLGNKFGIVSLGPSSIARHHRYLVELKLEGRLAGDRSIDMTIPQLMANDVVEILARIGSRLRDLDGADVVILGCAGLGSYRSAMEAELGLPIVDPVQAGAALACTRLDLQYLMQRKPS